MWFWKLFSSNSSEHAFSAVIGNEKHLGLASESRTDFYVKRMAIVMHSKKTVGVKS